MALDREVKKWIDSSSYEDLVKAQRFAQANDPRFIGDNGSYFLLIKNRRYQELTPDEIAIIHNRT